MMLKNFRSIILTTLTAAIITLPNFACNDEIIPPDPTDNNKLQTAWDVDIPYLKEIAVPSGDSAEFFHFGIGSDKSFCSVITVSVEILEPLNSSFKLDAELSSQAGTTLVHLQVSDSAALWVASRPEQLYYLRLIPTGELESDLYRYRIGISSFKVNDPYEPDNLLESAHPLQPGLEKTAYLATAYRDSVQSDTWLGDFYFIELDEPGTLSVTVSELEHASGPVIRLYDPSGENSAEIQDTTAWFDLTQGFEPGRWYLELNEAQDSYPCFGKGEVPWYYIEPYTLMVTMNPSLESSKKRRL